jgi:hypothetical protein
MRKVNEKEMYRDSKKRVKKEKKNGNSYKVKRKHWSEMMTGKNKEKGCVQLHLQCKQHAIAIFMVTDGKGEMSAIWFFCIFYFNLFIIEISDIDGSNGVGLVYYCNYRILLLQRI